MRLTKEAATTQARALREALASSGVAVKHTKALDLVCAAHGLRSRGALAASPEGDARPNMGRLAAVARPLALHDDRRLAAILSGTTALTHPVAAVRFDCRAGNDGWHGRRSSFEVPGDAPREVGSFLATEAGRACLGTLAGSYHHTRYERDRNDRAVSLKEGSALAEALLRRGERSAAEVLAKRFGWGADAHEAVVQQGVGAVERFVEALDEALEGTGGGGVDDAEAWVDRLVGEVADHLDGEDDSGPEDMLGDWDLAEVVFVFGVGASDCEDVALQASGPSLSAAGVVVDDNLRSTLAALGYTLGEYRALSGSRRPTSGRTRRVPVRRDKVVPWEAVREAIDEACSSFTNLVLYAQVPVTDLADLDPRRPMRFSRARFASYGCLQGTFFDTATVEGVVVHPSQGFLATCHGWYGPDEVCGLVSREYAGRLANAT